MCWNPDISLNTFFFAILVLLFVFLSNTFTKYKSETFHNPLVYLYLLEISFIQLIEFFLWRNLENKQVNEQLSKLLSLVISIQPPTLMLMMPNSIWKYTLLASYGVIMMFYVVYRQLTNLVHVTTTVGSNGHLIWAGFNIKGYDNPLLFGFLLFYSIPLFFINNPLLVLFVLVSMLTTLFFYSKHKTFSTMWCWTANIFLLYFVVDILLVKPFYEYNGLC